MRNVSFKTIRVMVHMGSQFKKKIAQISTENSYGGEFVGTLDASSSPRVKLTRGLLGTGIRVHSGFSGTGNGGATSLTPKTNQPIRSFVFLQTFCVCWPLEHKRSGRIFQSPSSSVVGGFPEILTSNISYPQERNVEATVSEQKFLSKSLLRGPSWFIFLFYYSLRLFPLLPF